MHLTDEHISSLMTAIEDAQTSETEAARQWMNEHKELVDSWIPKDSATE